MPDLLDRRDWERLRQRRRERGCKSKQIKEREMMMKRGGGALTEQSTRPLCPWLPLGTGFGVPPRWGRGGERVRVTEPIRLFFAPQV